LMPFTGAGYRWWKRLPRPRRFTIEPRPALLRPVRLTVHW
jgi:hypothetical protein